MPKIFFRLLVLVFGGWITVFSSASATAATVITEADFGGDFAGTFTNPTPSTDIGFIGFGTTTISGLNDDFVDAVHFTTTGTIKSIRYVLGEGNPAASFGITFGRGSTAILAGFNDPNHVLIDDLIVDNPYDETFAKNLAPGDYFLTWHDSNDPIAYSVTIQVVPLPAAAWLFISAIAGLAGAKRLSRSKGSA